MREAPWPTAHRQVSRLISSRRKIVRLTAAVMGCWQTEHKLKIVHHGLGASNQPHDSRRPVVVEQAHARNAHSYQLDHLVETGAEQALLRGAGGIPGEERFLRLLQSRLVVGRIRALQIDEELPAIECRLG